MDYGAIYATKNGKYAKPRENNAPVGAGVPAKASDQAIEVPDLTLSRARPLPQGLG
ncbi:hypothetical protein PPTS312_08590 [Pseudomonas putida]|uniref:Uncharacterized protein n=1 Tax=Pseudomonas putida TaxID=303 RepID=A0A7U6RB09_PSEPU|nr:hypothetical protein PPTS312_08590 [Pseudomonas putida]